MKVLLISQNLRRPNPTALSYSFKRAIEFLGHECDLYDLSYYTNTYFNFIVKKNPTLRKKLLSTVNDELLKHISQNKIDAIFVVKGTYLLPETVQELALKHWIGCFNPDDPFNSMSWEGSTHSNIPDSIKHYSRYFIWSKKLVQKISQECEINVTYLPFALDKELIHTFNNVKEIYDVTFIGNGDKERQKWLDTIGKTLYEDDKCINVFGRYWKDSNGIRKHQGRFGDDYFKVFYESKVNINVLRWQNKGSTNMRTFEIPATGNFMIHESSDEAREFFTEDHAAVYFETAEELIDKCAYFLKHEAIRKKIAQNAFELTKDESFSYIGRLKTVLSTINSERK